MAIKIEGRTHRYIAEKEDDIPPRVGVSFEGAVLTTSDLPPGSTVMYPSGRIDRWSGSDWQRVPLNDSQEILLSAILTELRQIRERVSIATS